VADCSDQLRSWSDPVFATPAAARIHHAIPVAILSLANAEVRRQRLLCRGLPYGWVNGYWPATDMRHATSATIQACFAGSAWPRPDPLWPAPVVGCALSHGEAARWQASHQLPLMLVLEDDVIPASPDWQTSLLQALKLLLKPARQGSAFVCHLGPRPEQLQHTITRPLAATRSWHRPSRLSLITDPRPTLWRGHAYLISWAAACRTGLPHNQLAAVADDWHRRTQLRLVDRVYVRNAPLFLQDEQTPSNLVPLAPSVFQGPLRSAVPPLSRLQQSARYRLMMLLAQLTKPLPAFLR
jgi:hypothetical protein